MSDAQLLRLLDAAHRAVAGLPHDTDACALYRRAAGVAQARLPDPLALSVAGVLALAAENRRVSGVCGALGADTTMLALALAVLADEQD